MKGVLSNTTNRVHNQRSKNTQLSRDILKKFEQTEEIHLRFQEAKDELEKIKSKNMSAADRVQQLEGMYRAEEKIMERIAVDCKVDIFLWVKKILSS